MTDNQTSDQDQQITSIADAVVKLKELRESNKNLNEPDIEEKYAQLSLAFKTDKFTLGKRLDLQLRQRDIAEKNIESELRALRESLNALNQLCTESDMREIITKTQQHVDIVQQATMRMSSRAETYGAIQQEQRMNCAFETMLNYVEHLKLLYDKEHLELEEYRRLLAEHNLLPREEGKAHHDDDPKRPTLPPRSHSLSSSSKPESRTRLLSAVCLLNNNFESSRGAALNSGQVSPKSRRSSLPVGPLAQAGRVTHGSISERKDSQASKLSRESKLTRTESEESTSSKPESDSAPCPQLQEQPEEDAPAAELNDSSEVALPPSPEDIDEEESSTSLACSMQESACDNNEEGDVCLLPEIRVPVRTKHFYVLDFVQKVSIRRIWRWDNNTTTTVILHARYALSAILATAAMLTLVLTFIPNQVLAFL
ncbi:hypothetical protein JTE90_027516 [Oedothorax gibbosus]|uniref:Lymphoid-restricted membrane protein n=1 Tax=Oedothorax gibbosus TaxID=931172 RepID=A0AAV6VKU3_9ARAC|nr:hypothetical protein JTE90_027516 [Oedothorax gibbosus]